MQILLFIADTAQSGGPHRSGVLISDEKSRLGTRALQKAAARLGTSQRVSGTVAAH